MFRRTSKKEKYMSPQLLGKKAIVTGGTGGIGAATVRAFLKEGAAVATMDVNDQMGKQVLDALPELSEFLYLNCDISKQAEVNACFMEAVEWMGGLDVLANVAGVVRYNNAEKFTLDDWDFIMSVNAGGTFFTNQAAFGYLQKAGGGSIINVGSMAGIRPHLRNAIYSASKGAVMAWTRTVAAEWGQYNIRVNSVAPIANTSMADFTLKGTADELKAAKESIALSRQFPLRRLGHTDSDIAPVMVFLASDASQYITGQVISIDGGFCMVGS